MKLLTVNALYVAILEEFALGVRSARQALGGTLDPIPAIVWLKPKSLKGQADWCQAPLHLPESLESDLQAIAASEDVSMATLYFTAMSAAKG